MYSIIIVFKDRLDLLEDCVQSIMHHTNESYEIILVSNCSSNETNTVIRGYDAKIVINMEEKGFSYANNLGISASSGEIIVLLNNDIIVESDNWLSEMREVLEKSNADLVGTHSLWGIVAWDKSIIPERMKSLLQEDSDGKQVCYFIGFWFVMGRRKLFEEMPLNENIVSYFYEDMDYCLRMAEKGKKWTASFSQAVKHLSEQSISKLSLEHIDKAREEMLASWR